MDPMKCQRTTGDPVTILLVDDDDGVAKAVTRAFRTIRLANPIVRAIDGVDALERLRGENGKEAVAKPTVMLVDLNMPRMGGIELITELRKDPELRQTIVFVLTTSGSGKDIAEAYDAHISGYIRKDDAGRDFQGLIDLLDSFWKVVQMPRGEA